MRRLSLVLCLLASGCERAPGEAPAAAASAPVAPAAASVDSFAGAYVIEDKGEDSGVRPYEAVEALDVVKLDANRAFFRGTVVAPNTNMCSLEETARLKDGALVCRRSEETPGDACVMTVKLQGDRLILKDGYSCKDYCGANVSLEDTEFPVSIRKPITDPEKVMKGEPR